MKIVYCIPGLYNSGGMERVISCKANYLAQIGHEVVIVTTDQMERPIFFPLDSRIRTYDLDVNYEINNHLPVWHKIRTYWARQRKHRKGLEALLTKLRPDVTISTFGNEENFLYRLSDGSIKVLEYHFSKLKRLQFDRKGLRRYIDMVRTKLDEQVIKRYARFVVLTEEDRVLWGSQHTNIQVIPNPLPFVPEVMADTSTKRIIAAGRYCYQKNFNALLEAWAQLAPRFPDWRLDIYGDGEDRPALEALVERLGLGDRLALQRPTLHMAEEYAQSSIYAMTSRYEGLPMVLLEAQAMGLPIVSYACQCGPRDIITDGQDGYLVELHDVVGLVEALARLMDNESLRIIMGQRAHKASERYTIECIMSQWLTLFEELRHH